VEPAVWPYRRPRSQDMHFLFCFLPTLDAAYVTCWRDDLKVFVAYRPRRIIAQVWRGVRAWVLGVALQLCGLQKRNDDRQCEMTSLAGLKTCKARSTSHVWCVVDAGGDSQLTPRRGGLEYS